MMKKITMITAVVLWMSVGSLWAEERIIVGGSGALFDEVKEMVQLYRGKNPSHQIEIMTDSMPTGGSIEATKAGRLTIGLVGRPLREDEKGRLVYQPFVRVPIAVGVNKVVGVSDLNESQICDIFSGKVKSWGGVGGSDEKVMVLTVIKKNDLYTDTVRKQMECFRDLRITSETIVLSRQLELLDALNRRSGTVALMNATSVRADRPDIRIVSIGGVAPTAEAVQNGKYKFYSETGVITVGEPQGVAKRFLEFVTTSPESHKILARRGMALTR